jgi:hypothetical protein
MNRTLRLGFIPDEEPVSVPYAHGPSSSDDESPFNAKVVVGAFFFALAVVLVQQLAPAKS